MVASVDPRQGRGNGKYLWTHEALPCLWVVDLVIGEHHADGGFHSDGRRFGRGWILPKRAANAKLKHGLGEWVQ